jgi:hypothetical protein
MPAVWMKAHTEAVVVRTCIMQYANVSMHCMVFWRVATEVNARRCDTPGHAAQTLHAFAVALLSGLCICKPERKIGPD